MNVPSDSIDPSTPSTQANLRPRRTIEAAFSCPDIESHNAPKCAPEQQCSCHAVEEASLNVASNVVRNVASTVVRTTLTEAEQSPKRSTAQLTSASALPLPAHAARRMAEASAEFMPSSQIEPLSIPFTQSPTLAMSTGMAVDNAHESTNRSTVYMTELFISVITISSTNAAVLQQGFSKAACWVWHLPGQTADPFALMHTARNGSTDAEKEPVHRAFGRAECSTESIAKETTDLRAVRSARGSTFVCAAPDVADSNGPVVELRIAQRVISHVERPSDSTAALSIESLSNSIGLADAAQCGCSIDLDSARMTATSSVEPHSLHHTYSQVFGSAHALPTTKPLHTLGRTARIKNFITVPADANPTAIRRACEHVDTPICSSGLPTTASIAYFSASPPVAETTNPLAISPAVPAVLAETLTTASNPAA